jgi:hypothetical protein
MQSGKLGDQQLGGTLGSVSDFWRWAYGDLRTNNVRGVFAEWMVAQLLGIKIDKRAEWDPFDLQLDDKRRIEVKCSGYLQSWAHENDPPSKICFSGLKSNFYCYETKKFSKEGKTYNADIYIFCIQIEKNPNRWNALDLDQWEFYVLERSKIEGRDSQSLSLRAIQRLSGKAALRADELRAAVLSINPPALQGRTDVLRP